MTDNLEELERLLKGPAWLVQLGEWTAKHGNTLIAWAVWMDRKAKVPFFWLERKDDE